jgi:hypothetical protein
MRRARAAAAMRQLAFTVTPCFASDSKSCRLRRAARGRVAHAARRMLRATPRRDRVVGAAFQNDAWRLQIAIEFFLETSDIFLSRTRRVCAYARCDSLRIS